MLMLIFKKLSFNEFTKYTVYSGIFLQSTTLMLYLLHMRNQSGNLASASHSIGFVRGNDQSAPTSGCPSANQNKRVEFSKPTRHPLCVLTEVDAACLLCILMPFY